MKSKVFKIFFIVAAAALFIAASVRGVNWGDFKLVLAQTDPIWFPAVFVCFFLTHFARTLRWGVMLSGQGDFSLTKLFAIHSVGFFSIYLLPFRLGEFVRPAALKKKEGVSFSFTMGTVVLERILDGLVCVGILLIAWWNIPGLNQKLIFGGYTIGDVISFGVYLFVPLLVFCITFPLLMKIVGVKAQTGSSSSYLNKAFDKLRIFGESFELLQITSRKFWSVVLSSILVWFTAVLAYHSLVLSFGFELGFYATMLVLGITTIGLMIPGPPGFIGSFHFFIQISLLLFAVPKSAGLAYATILYLINLLYILLAGLWGSWFLSFSLIPEKLLGRVDDSVSTVNQSQA